MQRANLDPVYASIAEKRRVFRSNQDLKSVCGWILVEPPNKYCLGIIVQQKEVQECTAFSFLKRDAVCAICIHLETRENEKTFMLGILKSLFPQSIPGPPCHGPSIVKWGKSQKP